MGESVRVCVGEWQHLVCNVVTLVHTVSLSVCAFVFAVVKEQAEELAHHYLKSVLGWVYLPQGEEDL